MLFPRLRSMRGEGDSCPSLSEARNCLVGEARKNHFLRVADVGTYKRSGARSIARPECLYDVVAPVRGALGELRAYVCDGAAELDLQRKPRQRLDQRGISGLLGDGLAKLPIAHNIGFHVSALQGDHGVDKDIFKPPDVAVAHLRDGEFNRETFKPLVQFVKVR